MKIRENMRNLIYNRRIKLALIVLQVILVGVLAWCVLNIGFWTEGNYSLREMSRSYEETDLFFRQVDQVVTNKIRGQSDGPREGD